jgi:hypothetical protein
MINVVNKYKHQASENDIYIGRGSVLGNPFSHLKSSKASVVVNSREEAIERYKSWLYKLKTGL